MKAWIRKYLGVDDIVANQQHLLQEHAHVIRGLYDLPLIMSEIGIHNRALGRIIAKLDPMFGIDELDPTRRAESDAFSKQIIDKIRAEFAMSNRIPRGS